MPVPEGPSCLGAGQGRPCRRAHVQAESSPEKEEHLFQGPENRQTSVEAWVTDSQCGRSGMGVWAGRQGSREAGDTALGLGELLGSARDLALAVEKQHKSRSDSAE